MDVFWDTSSVVALLLREPGTKTAQRAWARTSRAWAWRWMAVEAEAALARRKASPEAWSQWPILLDSVTLLDIEPGQWDALRAMNRALRLRAADAGHLFAFERASAAIPGLTLATLDREMLSAARQLGLATLH